MIRFNNKRNLMATETCPHDGNTVDVIPEILLAQEVVPFLGPKQPPKWGDKIVSTPCVVHISEKHMFAALQQSI